MESWAIAIDSHNEDRLEALIKMEVACRLGLESLRKLPPETQETRFARRLKLSAK